MPRVSELISVTGVEPSIGEYIQKLLDMKQTESVVINNTDDYRVVEEAMNKRAKHLKYMEGQKSIYRAPDKQALDNIDSLFDPAIKFLKREVELRKNAMSAHQEKARIAEAEERRRLREEQAAAQKKAEEKAEKAARKAEASGDNNRADEIRNQPVVIPQGPQTEEAPRTKGQQDKYKVLIVDVEAILKWQAENPNDPFRPIIEIAPKDITRLNKQATLCGGRLNIPGIETKLDINIRAGG